MQVCLNEALCPAAQQDDTTRKMVSWEGEFYAAKRLDDGTYVGMRSLLDDAYVLVLNIGTDQERWYRYNVRDARTMALEYMRITSGEDVPQGWVGKRP